MKSSILSTAALLVASVQTAPLPTRDVDTRGFETMGALSAEMSKRQSFSVVENQLGECKPVTVIFARGTIELGNVGSLAGPPFFNALDAAIGAQNVGVQGVPYPASIWGYLSGGSADGGRTLAALTEQAMSECPQSQIVLSGYRYAVVRFEGKCHELMVNQSRSSGGPSRGGAATSCDCFQGFCRRK